MITHWRYFLKNWRGLLELLRIIVSARVTALMFYTYMSEMNWIRTCCLNHLTQLRITFKKISNFSLFEFLSTTCSHSLKEIYCATHIVYLLTNNNIVILFFIIYILGYLIIILLSHILKVMNCNPTCEMFIKISQYSQIWIHVLYIVLTQMCAYIPI